MSQYCRKKEFFAGYLRGFYVSKKCRAFKLNAITEFFKQAGILYSAGQGSAGRTGDVTEHDNSDNVSGGNGNIINNDDRGGGIGEEINDNDAPGHSFCFIDFYSSMAIKMKKV